LNALRARGQYAHFVVAKVAAQGMLAADARQD